MRKNEVRIINELGQEAVVVKSAFEKVWAARGWVKKEIKLIEIDGEAEIEYVEGEIADELAGLGDTPPADTTPPADVVVPPAEVVPPKPAGRLGRDGGTGTPESTQTSS